MRLEIVGKDEYNLFINKLYVGDIDINDNDSLGKYIKQIIIKIRKIYDIMLEGFYEVHVYPVGEFGIILIIKNIDKYLSKTVDLKIIVHNDEEIYIQIPDYDQLKNYTNLKYLNNFFYIDINQLKDKSVLSFAEHYQIVCGERVKELKVRWHNLTK